jgi:hypothetical protein
LLASVQVNARDIHKNGNINLKEFSDICTEAEGDARDGSRYEEWCELYLAGFAAALQTTQPKHYCLPEQPSWLDQIRRDFTLWYFKINRQGKAIPEGMLEFFNESYTCN